MAPFAGFDCIFMSRTSRQGLLATASDYTCLYNRTLGLLRDTKPRVLWLQLPPVPLLWAALYHRRFVDPRIRLVADCHNAMFGKRWAWVPWGVSWLNRCDLVVVHTEAVLKMAKRAGVASSLLFLLEDIPALQQSHGYSAPPSFLRGRQRPWILFPGSFNADEPVAELLEAARSRPEWTFILTGKLASAKRNGHILDVASQNVIFPGYLPTNDFDALLSAVDVVLALTTVDGIQLSVCNEALAFSKAMVVSDTPLLRRLFGAAAVMTDSSRPDAIAEAVESAIRSRDTLEQAATRLADLRRRAGIAALEAAPPWLVWSVANR